MILTITLNPSIDYLYTKNTFELGIQNRFSAPIRMVGGKGINAGRTAAILGSEVFVTGVLAGINGQIVQDLLAPESFSQHFFSVSGETRNAITIMHNQGIQTEIVEEGPSLDVKITTQLLNYVISMCLDNPSISVICLSGSANTENETLYQDFIQQIETLFGDRIKVLADISGVQLRNVLTSPHLPFFIKPNVPEFSELLGMDIRTKEDIYAQLNHPLIKDIPLLLVSCGECGAIAKYRNTIYDLEVPTIDLINPTGSGDATVGGIAYALDQDLPIEAILQYGMSSGVANALEQAVGFVKREIVTAMLDQIKLNRL